MNKERNETQQCGPKLVFWNEVERRIVPPGYIHGLQNQFEYKSTGVYIGTKVDKTVHNAGPFVPLAFKINKHTLLFNVRKKRRYTGGAIDNI